jgi:hypothetical protein
MFMGKYVVALLCVCFTSFSAFSQVVKPEDAPQLIGKTVTVCGEIFSGRYLESSKTTPTLLNMGAAYPKQPLTIVIPQDVRRTMGFRPEELLKNKHVCVTGKITKYQGTAQIVITDKSQLRML